MTRTLATSIVVSWQHPTEDGTEVSSYDLRYREGNTGNFIDGPQDVIGTRAIILGLSPDTEYEVQIRASNSSGDSGWSELEAVRTRTRILQDRFYFSLDLDGSEGNQFKSYLSVAPDGLVSVQIFGKSLNAIPSNDLSLRFEYDMRQVVFEKVKIGDALSSAYVLAGKNFVSIGMTLPDSKTRAESGLMGTIRFRTTDAISETEIRFVQVNLLPKGQSEIIPMFLSVALQGYSSDLPATGPSPDFNENGVVDIPDFLLFADVFGAKMGQKLYETKYDLDRNGEIGISDFLIFVDAFGKEIVQVPPLTTPALPVTRFIEENTSSGQLIGDPISAASPNGDTLTYSLWGMDAEYFTIDANTGQLETGGTYNFEERNWYSPIVRVSDGKSSQVSVVVNIAIIDVAE